MKIICECGHEGAIDCPPAFGETMRFAFGHGHSPLTVKAVCACGADRLLGPGAAGEEGPYLRGVEDGKWFLKHASCGAN
jgi:hypothetical protein